MSTELIIGQPEKADCNVSTAEMLFAYMWKKRSAKQLNGHPYRRSADPVISLVVLLSLDGKNSGWY